MDNAFESLLMWQLEQGKTTLQDIKEKGERFLAFYEKHKGWKPEPEQEDDDFGFENQKDVLGFEDDKRNEALDSLNNGLAKPTHNPHRNGENPANCYLLDKKINLSDARKPSLNKKDSNGSL